MRKIIIIIISILSVFTLTACNGSNITNPTYKDAALTNCLDTFFGPDCDLEQVEIDANEYFSNFQDTFKYKNISISFHEHYPLSRRCGFLIEFDDIPREHLTLELIDDIQALIDQLETIFDDYQDDFEFGFTTNFNFDDLSYLHISTNPSISFGRVEFIYRNELDSSKSVDDNLFHNFNDAVRIISKFNRTDYSTRKLESHVNDQALILNLYNTQYEITYYSRNIIDFDWTRMELIVKSYFITYTEMESGV